MIPTSLPIHPLLMVAVFGLPLALGIGLSIKRWQPAIIRLAPWSALPALAAVMWVPSDEIISIPWILLEMYLAMDPTGRLFLLFTSILWLLSGIYAQSYLASDPRRGRFFFFFLLSMAGNFGLIVSQDAVSFYVFFALMSFASYGLVVHNGDSDALQAGRIYIYLVVIGEILLFTAFLLQTWTVDSLLLQDFSNVRPKAITIGLVLIGFGIKAGALPVHVWLPLAHPAAPTPASAVLSGAMIKAGLLGWLRFLPIGLLAMPGWGTLCIIAGLLAAYYAVAVGVDPAQSQNDSGVFEHQPNGSDDGGSRPGDRMAANCSDDASGHRNLRRSSWICKGSSFSGSGRPSGRRRQPAGTPTCSRRFDFGIAGPGRRTFYQRSRSQNRPEVAAERLSRILGLQPESVVAPGRDRHNASHGPVSFCDNPTLVCPRPAAVWHVAVVDIHDSADGCCGLVIAGGPESSLKGTSACFPVAGAVAGRSGHTDFRHRMAAVGPQKATSGIVHTAG